MLFLLILGALVRVYEPLGYARRLPSLKEPILSQKLISHNRSVVFFSDSDDVLGFADTGIEFFRNQIYFAKASEEIGGQFGCEFFPCIVPFSNGEKLDVQPSPPRPAHFLNWLKMILTPNFTVIRVQEQLRRIFSGQQPVLFGVDLLKRPDRLPSKLPFYLVKSQMLQSFNLTANKGLYVYRPADRELTAFVSDDQVEDCVLYPAGLWDIERPFLGFVVVDEHNYTNSKELLDIAKRAAVRFSSNLSLTVGEGGKLAPIIRQMGLDIVAPPFFFLLNVQSNSFGRWMMYGEDMDQFDVLCEQFIEDVINDRKPYMHVSEPLPEEPSDLALKKLVYDNYEEVMHNCTEAVVVVLSSWHEQFHEISAMLQVSAELLNGTHLPFFWFDVSHNERPPSLPDFETIPSVFLITNGTSILLEKHDTIPDILSFLAENSNLVSEIPQFNPDAMDERITEIIRSRLPPVFSTDGDEVHG